MKGDECSKRRDFKTIKIFFVLLFFCVCFFPFISSDIISINPGGSQEVVITPSRYIEGFFFGMPEEEEEPGDDEDEGGDSGGGGGEIPEGPSGTGFYVSPSSFEINLEVGSSTQRKVSVGNLEADEMTLSISKEDPNGILKIEKDSVTVGSNELEEFVVTFIAPNERGTYEAEIQVEDEVIPVTLNVFYEMLLFDSRIIVLNEDAKVSKGEELRTRSTLIPMSPDPRVDVTIDYSIMDYNRNEYITESETLLIEEQMDFDKNFSTKDLSPGRYLVTLDLVYLNGVAPSRAHFEVIEPEGPDVFAILIFILLIIILIIGIILILLLIKRYKDKKEEREEFINS